MYKIYINDEEVVVESNFEINEEFMNTFLLFLIRYTQRAGKAQINY